MTEGGDKARMKTWLLQNPFNRGRAQLIMTDYKQEETPNQEKVWDEIAPEWHEFKKIPAQRTAEFLERRHGNVLDFGGGSGRHLVKIRKGKMFILDISQKMLDLAEEKGRELGIEVETIHSPMDVIPKEDGFFDFAICISALHCVERADKRLKAVEELYRVLKKGGEAYIGVWNVNSKRFVRKRKKGKDQLIGWRDKGDRYYYLYDECEVHDLFKSVGFEVVSNHNSEMMINFVVRKN